VRLLAYWIVFMVLLVVFVPAFSMIFSPAYIPQKPCPECPSCECECPECPPPPPCECPQLRFYPIKLVITDYYIDDYYPDYGFFSFTAFTTPPQHGYRYFLLINIPRHKIVYEVMTYDWFTDDAYVIDFFRFNATHSYAFTRDPLSNIEFFVCGMSPSDWNMVKNRQIYLIVALVEETASLSEILANL